MKLKKQNNSIIDSRSNTLESKEWKFNLTLQINN